MITKFNLINEALTSKMYHFTNISNLVNILKEDAFFTSPVIGTGADSNVNDDKFYFFAMQTSRHGEVAFADSIPKAGKVCINIDGQKLNQNHKSKRVDYWQTSRKPEDHGKHDYMHHLTRYDELEERIITNKSEIEEASKYIEGIHVLLIKDGVEHYVASNMIELKKYISDVDIYFYDNVKYFNNQVKNKSININDVDYEKDIDKDAPKPRTHYYIPLTRIMSLMTIGDGKLKGEIFKWLKKSVHIKKIINFRNTNFKGTNSELSMSKIIKDIEEEAKKDYNNYSYSDFYLQDYLNSISADIHNYKSSTNPIARHIIQTLTKDMNKHNVKNLKNYVLYKNEITKNK